MVNTAPEIRDDAERAGEQAHEQRVIQPDDEEANGVNNAEAHRDQHLAAEEHDQVVVDRREHEDRLVFGARFADGQVICPLVLDA
jgi:hypothetical protein